MAGALRYLLKNMTDDFFIGILNGGSSRRMGSPKSLAVYNGTTFAEIIYKEASEITQNIVFLGASPLPDSLKDKTVIPDDGSGGGPFQAARSAYVYRKTDWFLWAVDMPLITKDIVLDIISQKGRYNGNSIPYNKDLGVFEPFCAYYSKNLLRQLSLLYSDKFYSIQKMFRFLEIKGNSEIFEKYKNEIRDFNYCPPDRKQYEFNKKR